MKKIETLFSIAALICITACSNREFADLTSGDKEIQFLSRNPIENVNQLTEFSVWAQKDNNWQFTERSVNKTVENTWQAEQRDFWQSGKYNFYAIAGYSPNSVTPNINGNFIIVVGENETDLDLMTAIVKNITYPVADGETLQPIGFHFKHEKAKLGISIKTDSQLQQDATIKSVKLSNFYDRGTFTRTFLSNSEWSGSWSYEGINHASWAWESAGSNLKAGESQTFLSDYMIPAQQLSGITLIIQYELGMNSFDKSFDLSQATGSGNWLEAGVNYQYNFTIRPDGIIFDGITMNEWQESHSGGDINIEE